IDRRLNSTSLGTLCKSRNGQRCTVIEDARARPSANAALPSGSPSGNSASRASVRTLEIAGLAGRVGVGGEAVEMPALLELMQRPAHRGESDVVPRDPVEFEQANLQTLRPRADVVGDQACPIHQLHLADARDGIDREQGLDLDPGARLLPGFAR